MEVSPLEFRWLGRKHIAVWATLLCVILTSCGYHPMNTVLETRCEWPNDVIVFQKNTSPSHRRKFSQIMKKHLLDPNQPRNALKLQIRLIRDELNPSQFTADSAHLSARHHQKIQLDVIEGTQILWTKTLVNGLSTVRNAPTASISYGQIERTRENGYIEAAKRIEKELQTHCFLWSKKD